MMSDDVFARLVAEEVKNKATPAQRELIMLPENRERWKRALQELNVTLADQLADIDTRETRDSARFKEMGAQGARLLELSVEENQRQRKRVERFKFFVEQRMGEVEAMGLDEVTIEPEITIYQRAIEAHKALTERENWEPTAQDEALWAVLDGRWLFDAIAERAED